MNFLNILKGKYTPEKKLELISDKLMRDFGGVIKSGRVTNDSIEFDYEERYPTGIVESSSSDLKITGRFKTIIIEKRQ